MSKRGVFVSDLHKFARRSQTDRFESQIRERVKDADVLVLGGDIFDFRWSTIGDFDLSIQAAVEWIEEIGSINPECKLHYVLGNHDCNLRFVDALKENRPARFPRLEIHPFSLRLGGTYFTHGDVTDRVTSHQQFIRFRKYWQEDEQQKPPYRHTTYDVAVKLRLHKLLAKTMHRHRAVINRLTSYMSETGHDFESGVRQVFFGHTHHAMTGFEFAGMSFFNCGAPLAGLDFAILDFEVDSGEASVNSILTESDSGSSVNFQV